MVCNAQSVEADRQTLTNGIDTAEIPVHRGGQGRPDLMAADVLRPRAKTNDLFWYGVALGAGAFLIGFLAISLAMRGH